MSAPNQLQQNSQPGAYYLDQYVEKLIPMAASNSSGAFSIKTRIHREGNLVMITVDWDGVVGTGTATSSYSSVAGAIPDRFISSANAPYGAIVKIDTGANVKGLAILAISSVGQIVLFPAYTYPPEAAGVLPEHVFITQCTFSYFI